MQIESRETHRKEEQPQSIGFELHERIPSQLPLAGAVDLPAARGGVS